MNYLLIKTKLTNLFCFCSCVFSCVFWSSFFSLFSFLFTVSEVLASVRLFHRDCQNRTIAISTVNLNSWQLICVSGSCGVQSVLSFRRHGEPHVVFKGFASLLYNTPLLPIVNTIGLGMFYGARYIHHTFTPIIKHN